MALCGQTAALVAREEFEMQNRQHIRVIAFREGGLWVAQCLEYDIGAQAPDLDTLQSRFRMAVMAELQTSAERGVELFAGIDPAPEHFHRLWERRSGGFTPAHPPAIKDDTGDLEVEMALAA